MDQDNENEKSRIWAAIVYPSSAPKDWLEQLKNTKIPCYVSPCHNHDPGVKAHYHVLLLFQGQKTRNTVKSIIKEFSGVGAERIHSKIGYLLYLTHKGTIDKYQYSEDDVLALNGAKTYIEAIKDDSSYKYDVIQDIITWINNNNISCFADVVTYSMNQNSQWFKFLVDKNSNLIFQYIKSRSWKYRSSDL